MPREFSRSQRMAEQIRRDLAEIIRDELKDPRMGFLSFSAVKLSRDLGTAVIYCSVMEEDKQKETLATLNRAMGFRCAFDSYRAWVARLTPRTPRSLARISTGARS